MFYDNTLNSEKVIFSSIKLVFIFENYDLANL